MPATRGSMAMLRAVMPDSVGYEAGFTPGCSIVAVDGNPIRDIIDWQWYSAADVIDVEYVDTQGDAGCVTLSRSVGEPWGFEFDGVIFDGIHECRNACTFCFMRMLPSSCRPSLVLRDDDFRLSFLSGTFVTFTNMTPDDERRIIEQHISPLRYSLHAIEPQVREGLIGRNAPQGVEVAERLMAAGIHLHAQIVLVPGVNDGKHLDATLEWAYAHEQIDDVGIVPLGYTRFQERFSQSFSGEASAVVLQGLEPFRQRALRERGCVWVYAADEFYINAYPQTLFKQLPCAEEYGDYSMFEDGIGLVRYFIDDWRSQAKEERELARVLQECGRKVVFIAGCAQKTFFGPLINSGPLAGLFVPLFVDNNYFGGNVDVTGLLCGCDIAAAIAADDICKQESTLVVIPEVVLNDDKIFLDDMTMEGLEQAAGRPVCVVSCNASDFFPQIIELLQ